MSEDEKRKKARETAELRYWLRWHVLLYVIINAGLVLIWYSNGAEAFLWPLIPMAFWFIGLIAHYLIAYHRFVSYGNWIDKETDKLLQDME
jgi:membrane protein YdbS with pleckstrin-like domain